MKSFWLPLGLLVLTFALCLYNGALVGQYTQEWSTGIEAAESAAVGGDWAQAHALLEKTYENWQQHQTYLHIVEIHGDLDAAEASFLRLLACTETEDMPDFRMEIQSLLSHLRLLAETEQLSIKNIL